MKDIIKADKPQILKNIKPKPVKKKKIKEPKERGEPPDPAGDH